MRLGHISHNVTTPVMHVPRLCMQLVILRQISVRHVISISPPTAFFPLYKAPYTHNTTHWQDPKELTAGC